MNKNTQILLGVAAVLAVGYYFYTQQSSKKASFIRGSRMTSLGMAPEANTCPCKKVTGKGTLTTEGGGSVPVNICADGHICPVGLDNTTKGGA